MKPKFFLNKFVRCLKKGGNKVSKEPYDVD